jgi:hypothetical protein
MAKCCSKKIIKNIAERAIETFLPIDELKKLPIVML